MKIPIKKFVRPGTGWYDDYRALEAHHEEETSWLIGEVKRLESRQQELLQTIANLTHTVPFPDEYQGWESQRAAMLAEIGSLRAQVKELERRLYPFACQNCGTDHTGIC